MRIAIVINGPDMARNYIESGALEELRKFHHLLIFAPSETASRIKMTKSFEIVDFPAKLIARNHYFFFDVLRWKYRKKSVSFISRSDKLYPKFSFFLRRYLSTGTVSLTAQAIGPSTNNQKSEPSFESSFKKAFALLKSVFSFTFTNLTTRTMISICASRLCFSLYVLLFKPRKPTHKILANKILDFRPELIIYPTSGFETLALDLVMIAKASDAKTLFVYDNWDNLSSKTVIWSQPDFIATWGPQSTRHAHEISNFPSNRIFEVGSARFSSYNKERTPDVYPELCAPYILFVGSSLIWDEAKVLKIIDDWVDSSEIRRNLRVIYRPHPEGVHKTRFSQDNYKHVTLDNQTNELARLGALRPSGNLSQFSLDYYPSLISNAELVVGGHTSMLIEATLFGKTFICFEHDEPFNLSNPSKLRSSYAHFEGLENLPNLIFCQDLKTLHRLLDEVFFEQANNVEIQDCLNALQYFVDTNVSDFPLRLLQIADEIHKCKPQYEPGNLRRTLKT